jgi:YVTN family beta-propeller protein
MKQFVDCSSALIVAGLLFAPLAQPLAASTVLIYITNAAGDRVHVIDAATNKVVNEIRGIEIPSGVDFSHDSKTIYFSCEGEKTLDFVEQATGKIIAKVPLTGRPNSISTSPDGKLVFVAIAQGPGGVDVIDVESMKRIKTIPIKGAVHYAYLTPDGKYIAAASIGGKIITLIDIKTQEAVRDFNFKLGVRPVAFEKGPDGLTSRMFVQESGLHGFEVIDFKTGVPINTVTLPDEPISMVGMQSSAPSHGIAVAPDNKTLWVNSSVAGAVFIYALPELKLLGHTVIGDVPDWLTFTPDSKVVYISNAGSNSVSAIDTKTFKEIARIPVGETPKRSGTLVIP